MSGEGLYGAPACADVPAEPISRPADGPVSGPVTGPVSEPEPVLAPVSVEEVSGAVAEWVDQVGRFLGVLQVAIEESSPREDASAEVRALAGQLPALIRQCRAQVPTPEMIRTWVRSLSADGAGAVGAGAVGAARG